MATHIRKPQSALPLILDNGCADPWALFFA